MPRFLVESYVVKTDSAFDDACDVARRTAETGRGIRYVETTYLPGDETVMHLFDAPSSRALGAAGRRAGLEFERIVEAVSDSGDNRRKEQRDENR
jgi:hypothetical protein